jgi:hypothetical protein
MCLAVPGSSSCHRLSACRPESMTASSTASAREAPSLRFTVCASTRLRACALQSVLQLLLHHDTQCIDIRSCPASIYYGTGAADTKLEGHEAYMQGASATSGGPTRVCSLSLNLQAHCEHIKAIPCQSRVQCQGVMHGRCT